MKRKLAALFVAWIAGTFLLASPAHALTACISPCSDFGGNVPGGPIHDLVELTDLSNLATQGVDGLVFEVGSDGLTIDVDGDLVLHVPSGEIVATALRLSALETLEINIPLIEVADLLSLCGAEPTCLPFESDLPRLTGDPFHVTWFGTDIGPLNFSATGSILVTQTPIPEPGTGAMIAAGLVGLAGRRHARSLV
jgi:hypothetical protein